MAVSNSGVGATVSALLRGVYSNVCQEGGFATEMAEGFLIKAVADAGGTMSTADLAGVYAHTPWLKKAVGNLAHFCDARDLLVFHRGEEGARLSLGQGWLESAAGDGDVEVYKPRPFSRVCLSSQLRRGSRNHVPRGFNVRRRFNKKSPTNLLKEPSVRQPSVRLRYGGGLGTPEEWDVERATAAAAATLALRAERGWLPGGGGEERSDDRSATSNVDQEIDDLVAGGLVTEDDLAEALEINAPPLPPDDSPRYEPTLEPASPWNEPSLTPLADAAPIASFDSRQDALVVGEGLGLSLEHSAAVANTQAGPGPLVAGEDLGAHMGARPAVAEEDAGAAADHEADLPAAPPATPAQGESTTPPRKKIKIGADMSSSFAQRQKPEVAAPAAPPPAIAESKLSPLDRVLEQRRQAVEDHPGFDDLQITLLCMENYLVSGATMTNFRPTKESYLGLLLTHRGKDVRTHGYRVYEYEANSGAWVPTEALRSCGHRVFVACEGLLLDVLKTMKELGGDFPAWSWSAISERVIHSLTQRKAQLSAGNTLLDCYCEAAKVMGDHLRRDTENKPWKASWLARLADVASKAVSYYDTARGVNEVTKLFLLTCETPMPPHRGVAFLDCYLDEAGEEAPRSRSNDCYFKVPFKLHATEGDVTKPGWDIAKYDRELDVWLQSMYYDSGPFFTVKLISYKLAFKGMATGKMIFEVGRGGDGKGREAVFEKTLFGDSFGTLDCEAFLDRTEWRRSGHLVWQKRCVRIQEFDAHTRMLADIWKRFIVGEELHVRENYGFTAKKSFGESTKTQELNFESVPVVEQRADVFADDEPVLEQVRRREICGIMGKGTYVKDPKDVDHAHGKFLSKPQEELDSFLSDKIVASRFYERYLLPFDKDYSDNECLRMLDDLGKIDAKLVTDQTWLARKLCGMGAAPNDHKAIDVADALVRRVHKETRNAPIIRLAAITELDFVPGLKKLERSTKGKQSKVEKFEEAVLESKIKVFQVGDRRSCFKKMMVDLDVMEKCVGHHGGAAVFGDWSTWGDTFELAEEQKDCPALTDEDLRQLYTLHKPNYLRPVVAKLQRLSVAALPERVNLKLLRAYAQRGVDPSQQLLDKTIGRYNEQGHRGPCAGLPRDSDNLPCQRRVWPQDGDDGVFYSKLLWDGEIVRFSTTRC